MLPYDPKTLKNLPRYTHELPAPSGAPKPKEIPVVDLSKLIKKWGAK